MLRDATQAALFEVLENNDIPFSHSRAENILTFKETGSQILFRSMDEYERLRGTNIAWFGMDELTYTHEEAWLRLEGRLRDPKASQLCGFAVWTPKGYDWVYRRFLDAAESRYEVVRARAFENTHILDRIPDYYDRLRQSYDLRFYQQEVLGEYLNAAGDRVYHAFEFLKHVQPLTQNAYKPICWAMDFNVDPMSSVVVQMDQNGFQILDEIVLKRASTQDACDEFSKRYGGHGPGYVVYGDASGQSQSTKGGTDYEIVVQHFRRRREQCRLELPKSNPLVKYRVNEVNAKLMSADGVQRITVDPKCTELIKDFEQVCFMEDNGAEIDKKKDRMRTHASDALGYLVWYCSRPIAKVGERSQELL